MLTHVQFLLVTCTQLISSTGGLDPTKDLATDGSPIAFGKHQTSQTPRFRTKKPGPAMIHFAETDCKFIASSCLFTRTLNLHHIKSTGTLLKPLEQSVCAFCSGRSFGLKYMVLLVGDGRFLHGLVVVAMILRAPNSSFGCQVRSE